LHVRCCCGIFADRGVNVALASWRVSVAVRGAWGRDGERLVLALPKPMLNNLTSTSKRAVQSTISLFKAATTSPATTDTSVAPPSPSKNPDTLAQAHSPPQKASTTASARPRQTPTQLCLLPSPPCSSRQSPLFPRPSTAWTTMTTKRSKPRRIP
jgi:hypothetical protein